MRARAVVLAVALVLAPLGAKAADLVVWWDKGFYAQEDEALREIIAAFEQRSGKQVELVLHRADGVRRQAPGGDRGRPAARHRMGRRHRQPTSRNGPITIGSWISPTPSGPFRTCSIRTRSPGMRYSTGRPSRERSMRCRWAASPTTSTSGRACSSARASRSPISLRNGRRSGRSGATRCSRRCAGRPGATTSGASASTCRASSTARVRSTSSAMPTGQTT